MAETFIRIRNQRQKKDMLTRIISCTAQYRTEGLFIRKRTKKAVWHCHKTVMTVYYPWLSTILSCRICLIWLSLLFELQVRNQSFDFSMQTTKKEKPRKLFVYKAFASFDPTLRRPLAVRRGFYPNPRNAPCIKWLHALPNEAGYTLVTRFYTSKSASLNALSMNLYTANVTSPFGTCKLYRLNRYTLYSSCSQRARRSLNSSPL